MSFISLSLLEMPLLLGKPLRLGKPFSSSSRIPTILSKVKSSEACSKGFNANGLQGSIFLVPMGPLKHACSKSDQSQLTDSEVESEVDLHDESNIHVGYWFYFRALGFRLLERSGL